jgi:hypothetical protein
MEWRRDRQPEPASPEILFPPTEQFSVRLSHASINFSEYLKLKDRDFATITVRDNRAWRQHILQRMLDLWPTLTKEEFATRAEEEEALQKEQWRTYNVLFTDTTNCASLLKRAIQHPRLTEKAFFQLAIDAYDASIPPMEDCGDDSIMRRQEISLCLKGCNVQVKIHHDTAQHNMLQCTATSCLTVLKLSWPIIKNKMLEMYPDQSIYVFVPEAVLSSLYTYQLDIDPEETEDLVTQAQADATWQWLVQNGFTYCGNLDHDPPGFEREYKDSFGSLNNICPYFKFEHDHDSVRALARMQLHANPYFITQHD